MRRALSDSPRVHGSVLRGVFAVPLAFTALSLSSSAALLAAPEAAPRAAPAAETTLAVTAAPPEPELDRSPEDANALPATGFEYGLRLGLELPIGDIDGGASVLDGALQTRDGSMGGVSSFGVPVSLDLGYRTSEHWWWGLNAGAGTGPVGSDCPDNASCEWASLRLAAQAMYSLQPASASSIPWFGLSLGYESLRGSVAQSLSVSQDPDASAVSVKAREYLGGPFLSLQGGLDFTLAEHLRIGPFLSGLVGSYLRDQYECPSALGCPGGSGLDEPKVHAWLGLGVRGSNGP